jgi:hypothetical protein
VASDVRRALEQVDLDFGTDVGDQEAMPLAAMLISKLGRLRELGLTLNSSFGDWFAGMIKDHVCLFLFVLFVCFLPLMSF